MRKFLDDIGVTNRPETMLPADKRQAQWQQERDTYGFDERETWNLQYSFYLWLYERLKMYLLTAGVNIDLNHHRFVYNETSYTQQQMIDMMLERLEFYFSDKYQSNDQEQWPYIEEIAKLWATVLPAMWW